MSVVYCTNIKPEKDRRLNTSPPINSSYRLLLAISLCATVYLSACDQPDLLHYELGEQVFLGTHSYPAVLPDEFEAFDPGQPVDVVIGTQGSMMVVAAVKTNRIPLSEDPFTITVILSGTDGNTLSRLSLRRYPTLERDMMMYFANLYAVVTATLEEEYAWDGGLASLHVQIRGLDGTIYVDETIEIKLAATDILF